jgi:hypothetical protein
MMVTPFYVSGYQISGCGLLRIGPRVATSSECWTVWIGVERSVIETEVDDHGYWKTTAMGEYVFLSTWE